jgi:uncharacterized repeat protein (TIGR01451 family)
MRSPTRVSLALFLWGLALLCGSVDLARGQGSIPTQLYLVKEVDRPTAQPGDVITYGLTFFSNNAVTGVSISDVLPSNTTFVSASNGGIQFGNTVFWSAGNLQARQRGRVTLQVRINPNVLSGTVITNKAEISSIEAPIGVTSNAVSVTVGSTPQSSQLVVTKAVDAARAVPGGLLNFTLNVANSGNTFATGVTLSDGIPAGTTGIAASDNGVIANGVASWNLGALAPGTSRQVTLQVQVNNSAGSTIYNTAQVTSDGAPGPTPSNSVTVAVDAGASLSITSAADHQTAVPNDVITFTHTVFNRGATAVNGAALFVVVPDGTQFLDATNGGVLSGDTVVWTFPTIAPGTGATVSFRVRVSSDVVPGTLLHAQAQLAVPASGTVLTGNTVNVTVGTPGATASLGLSVDRTAARPGDVVTYILSYANLGGTVVRSATILDPLPPQLNFLDAQGNVQIDLSTRTLRFQVGDLAPGAAGSVSFRAQVASGVSGRTAVSNQAQLVSSDLLQPVTSNSVTVTVGNTSLAGTYKLLPNPQNPNAFIPNPTSITVDDENNFTVTTLPDGLAPALAAQGQLNADGSFVVVTSNGQARFTGQIGPNGQSATVTVQRNGPASYSVLMPRTPDFNPLPDTLVGTFSGFATNAAGDRLRVLLTIDPGGNATFEGDVIQLFPTNLRFRSGAYQVYPDGRIGFGGQIDGVLRPAGNSLLLVYNYTGENGYQSVFQVPLSRQ